MYRIKKLDVIQTSKVVGLIYTILFAGIFLLMLPFFLLGASFGIQSEEFGALGIVSLIMMGFVVVFYGLIGFIATAVFCIIYNFIAGKIGGIEIELEKGQIEKTSAIENKI